MNHDTIQERIPYPSPPRFQDARRQLALAGLSLAASLLAVLVFVFCFGPFLDTSIRHRDVNTGLPPPLSPDAFLLQLLSLSPSSHSSSDDVPTTPAQAQQLQIVNAALVTAGAHVKRLSGGQVLAALPPSDDAAATLPPLLIFASVDAPEDIDHPLDVFTHVVTADDVANGLELDDGLVIPGKELAGLKGRTIAASHGDTQIGSARIGAAAAVELVTRIQNQVASTFDRVEEVVSPELVPTRWPHLFVLIAPDAQIGRALNGVTFDIQHIPPSTRVVTLEMMPRGSFGRASCYYSRHTASFHGLFMLPTSPSTVLPHRGSARAAAYATGAGFENVAPLQTIPDNGYTQIYSVSADCNDESCVLQAISCSADEASDEAFAQKFSTIATDAAATSNASVYASSERLYGNLDDSRPLDCPLPGLWSEITGTKPTPLRMYSPAAALAAGGSERSVLAVCTGGFNHGSPIEFAPLDDVFELTNDLVSLVNKYLELP